MQYLLPKGFVILVEHCRPEAESEAGNYAACRHRLSRFDQLVNGLDRLLGLVGHP